MDKSPSPVRSLHAVAHNTCRIAEEMETLNSKLERIIAEMRD